MQKFVLGLDIGGVIRCRQNVNECEPKILVDGAVEAVRALVELFEGRAYIVSRQQRPLWASTLSWLEDQKLFQNTGMLPGNVRFCEERSEKAEICAGLGITHFVDNRLEVFQHMHQQDVVPYRFHFRLADCLDEVLEVPPVGDVMVVRSWSETYRQIERTFKLAKARRTVHMATV